MKNKKGRVKKSSAYKWTRNGNYKGMVRVIEEPKENSEVISVETLFEPKKQIRVLEHELH